VGAVGLELGGSLAHAQPKRISCCNEALRVRVAALASPLAWSAVWLQGVAERLRCGRVWRALA
jgi:hypothetical protein